MAYSRIIYPNVASTSTTFAINFTLGYLSQSHVTCRVNDEVDGGGNPVYRTINWLTAGTGEISGSVVIGDDVVFERNTPKTLLTHDYQNGDIIEESNLDESFLQAIMIAHEALDGRFGTLVATLDMGNNKIINLVDGTDDQDAVTFKQLVDATGNAPAFAELAEQYANEAEGYRDQAEGYRDDSLTFATNADASADLAQKWANELEDVVVSGGQYSAFHWAQKAMDALTGLTASAVAFVVGSTGISGANVQLALESIASDWGKLARVNAWTKMQRATPFALTYGATVTPDFSESNIQTLTTATGNFTLAAPINVVAGQSGMFIITQGATPRTITYNGAYKFPDGVQLALTASAGAVDIISWYAVSSSVILCSMVRDVR